MKTVNYLRVSTIQQDVERQQDNINRYNAYKGNQVVKQFEEKESGKKDDRQQLKLMLQFVSNPENGIQQVVVDELSRLGRTRYVLEVIDKLNNLKINLCSIKEGISTLNPDLTVNANASLLTGIMSSLNSYELTTIRHRMDSGRKTAVKNGNHWGFMTAFGYGKEGKRMVIEPEAAEVVKQIFADYLAGLGNFQIAAKLNKNGIKTKMGSSWYNGSIAQLLKNPIYKGYQSYKGEHIHLPYLAIISETDWQKVQEITAGGNHRANHSVYTYKLDSSKMLCGVCGKKYTPQTFKNVSTYKCTDRITRIAGEKKTCTNFGISVNKLTTAIEHIITSYFAHTLLDMVDISQIEKDIFEAEGMVNYLSSEIKKSEQSESKLIDLVISSKISDSVFNSKLVEIQSERQKLVKKFEQSTAELAGLIKTKNQKTDLKLFIQDIKENQISKELLNKIVSKITIYPSDRKLTTRSNDNAVRVVLQIVDKSLAFHISGWAKDYELEVQREAATMAGSLILD